MYLTSIWILRPFEVCWFFFPAVAAPRKTSGGQLKVFATRTTQRFAPRIGGKSLMGELWNMFLEGFRRFRCARFWCVYRWIYTSMLSMSFEWSNSICWKRTGTLVFQLVIEVNSMCSRRQTTRGQSRLNHIVLDNVCYEGFTCTILSEWMISQSLTIHLGGETSNTFCFHPDPWGNTFWEAYFSDG